MPTKKLSELAKTIRSKNAGVNKITLQGLTRASVAWERSRCCWIKFTIYRS
jgi:hypothetical protein